MFIELETDDLNVVELVETDDLNETAAAVLNLLKNSFKGNLWPTAGNIWAWPGGIWQQLFFATGFSSVNCSMLHPSTLPDSGERGKHSPRLCRAEGLRSHGQLIGGHAGLINCDLSPLL